MILPKVAIKKILYATDLSEEAHYAFAYAVSLANTYSASITILHVLSKDLSVDSISASYIDPKYWEKIKKRTYEDARQTLIGKKREHIAIEEVLYKFIENAKSDALPFVTDEIIVKSGNPEDNIIEQAEERNCDIIVMGSHGHGFLENAIIGSTARRVVRRSSKPVLVVPSLKKR